MLGIRTAGAAFGADVEDLAHLDAGSNQLFPCQRDIGNDQVPLGRTGCGRREGLTELDRARGTVRRELDQDGRRDVEPPPELRVELLRAGPHPRRE